MQILYPPARPVNRVFGLGVLPAEKPAPAPVVTRWATDSEWAEEFERRTLSATQYRAMLAEIEGDRRDRESNATEAEMAECGITDARLEEMARDAALLDAACGFDFAPSGAEIEVRRVEIKGAAYVAELIAPGEDHTDAVRLTKLSDGTIYDVARTRQGRIVCDCPHFVFALEGTAEVCKHGAAMVDAGFLPPPAPGRRKVETMHRRAKAARLARRAPAIA